MELEIAELKLENERMFLGVTKDITERKVAEQQILDRTTELETANAELEAFGYSVSHDLRAPLRGMDGLSQALLEDYGDLLDSVAKDYLSRISKASRRMGRMIDDILKLSRATRQEIQVLDVDLSALARELLSELAARDDGRAVSFKVASDITVRGDPKLLRVVLDNLLGNAWKFTGNVESAHIEFGRHWEDDVAVYFVRDNGAGFDMAFADKLFGIFQRLHSTTEFEGTGVGLATVARLVRRHGGRVWAEGRVNEGATLYFTL
jgi:light-regulated signal transduction histidine kinase (bacteriophytochrome)